MQEHLKECPGIRPDEEEQGKRRTVMTRAQYEEVRNWSHKHKNHSKGANEEGAIYRHYKTIYDIINPEGTPTLDARKPRLELPF
jgi:hypothetical protein